MLAEDEVWIPYAVEVDGQIITIYDPAIHKRIPELEPGKRTNAGCSAIAPPFSSAES